MLVTYEVVCRASFSAALKLCWNGWKAHFKAKNKAFSASVPCRCAPGGTKAEKALFLALKCTFQPFQHSLSATSQLARHTTSYVTNIVCYITFIRNICNNPHFRTIHATCLSATSQLDRDTVQPHMFPTLDNNVLIGRRNHATSQITLFSLRDQV